MCGIHTEEEQLDQILKKLENGGVHKNVNLSRVALSERNFKNSTFRGFRCRVTQMTSCEFIGCHFIDLLEFSDSQLDDVIFRDCNFHHAEFDNVNLIGLKLHGCKFIESSFNQCHITFESIIFGTEFHKFTFTGSTIDNTETTFTTWRLGKFSICSINDSKFVNTNFTDVEFNLTNIYDSTFNDSIFKRIEHDFDFTATIRLCMFYSADLEDFMLPENFLEWNAQDEAALPFYSKVIKQIVESPNVNHLEDLNRILERIELISTEHLKELKQDVFRLYDDLATEAKIKSDYMYYSLMMKGFSGLPTLFQRADTQFLPQPQEIDDQKAMLYLGFKKYGLELEDIIDMHLLLKQLEQALEGFGRFEIVDIRKGSFIILLAGPDILILGALFFICKYALPAVKDLLDILLKWQEAQKNISDLKHRKLNEKRNQKLFELDVEAKQASTYKDQAEAEFIKAQIKTLKIEEERKDELHQYHLREIEMKLQQLQAKGMAMTTIDKLEIEKLEKEKDQIEIAMITDILELKDIRIESIEGSAEGKQAIEAVKLLKEKHLLDQVKVILPTS